LIPFRTQPPTPLLREGYQLLSDPDLSCDALNHLLQCCGEPTRRADLWQRVLTHSAWHLGVVNGSGQLVGFVRATSDQALNANLWDLLSDPADPTRSEVLATLVQAALARLRRELGGCSISLSAPPEALPALTRAGFVVDPGGIRAMGLGLQEP
jgi:hypothetical protein